MLEVAGVLVLLHKAWEHLRVVKGYIKVMLGIWLCVIEIMWGLCLAKKRPSG